MMDTGIADRLRARGLTVVEIDGWQTRGRTYATFEPRGGVLHDTVGALHGAAPSLGVVINGRAGLPGPLYQVLQGRDEVFRVIAAGIANHAGGGGWAGLSGNPSVHGLSLENVGTDVEPITDRQVQLAAVAMAAMIEPFANADAVCQHYEWTPTKVDAWRVDGDGFRAMVAHELSPPGPQFPWIANPSGSVPVPAVARLDGHVFRYIRGNDARLWEQVDGGLWHALDGVLVDGPAACADNLGYLHVFVRGGNSQLYHRYLHGTDWSGWIPLGGLLTSGPACTATVDAQGRRVIDVTVRGTDGATWARTYADEQWSGWYNQGGLS